jgi:hypothetical protein
MIDGYEAFGLYESLKLHFTKDSYDFHKYNGKSNISVTSFENRKDKYHFYKLSRKFSKKEELIEFLVANFVEQDGLWVGDLLTEDAEVNYRSRQKILQSLSYEFTDDLAKLFDGVNDPNEVIKVVDGDYPVLLTYTLQKETKIETLCILNSILGFLPMWDKKITDTIRWPNLKRKIVKYTAFLPKDVVKYKLILKKVIGK